MNKGADVPAEDSARAALEHCRRKFEVVISEHDVETFVLPDLVEQLFELILTGQPLQAHRQLSRRLHLELADQTAGYRP